MTTSIVIPVKSANQGKTRLAKLLDVPTRRGLTRAMVTDILVAIAQSQYHTAHTWVLTSDIELKPIIATYKANFLKDTASTLNASLQNAIRFFQSRNTQSLLILPSDIPLLQPYDLDQLHLLISRTVMPVVYLTPSYTGGTNLLYQNPIGTIQPRFGANSFKLHLEEARQQHINPKLYSAPTIRRDIDTINDLQRFITHQLAPLTHTYQFLRSIRPDLIEPSSIPKPQFY